MPVFKQRRGTSAALAAANETPAAGQIIYETDTNRIKVGNGVTPYNSLQYLVAPTAVADVVGLQAALTAAQAAAVSTALATVTKANVGLGNASNTSDADKPVSIAQAAADFVVQSNAAADATTKANAAQAFAIQRANHTGTQAISTITGLQTAINGRALESHTHLASAITDFTSAVVAVAPPTTNADLLTSGTLVDARLSANVVFTTDARLTNARAPTAHNHSAGEITSGTLSDSRLSANVVFTSDARLTDSRTPTAHNHAATEITSGTLSDSRLSANVVLTNDARLNDEVVEYATTDLFPATGATSIAYVATDASRMYRWTGAQYVEVGPPAVSIIALSDGIVTTAKLADASVTDAKVASITAAKITGLQTALDGKAGASHNHTASAITDFAAAVAAASPEEVVEYTTAASFPATGNSSLLYIATDAGRAYRWVGNQYAEIGPTSISASGGGVSLGLFLALS